MSDKNRNITYIPWEDLEYKIVCDLRGNTQVSTSFSAANIFNTPSDIEYHYLTEEEYLQEAEAQALQQEEFEFARKELMETIFKIVLDHFTPVQQRTFFSFLEGKNWTEIAAEQGCTESAVRQVMFGNSRGQGGIIRKLRKYLQAKTTSNSGNK